MLLCAYISLGWHGPSRFHFWDHFLWQLPRKYHWSAAKLCDFCFTFSLMRRRIQVQNNHSSSSEKHACQILVADKVLLTTQYKARGSNLRKLCHHTIWKLQYVILGSCHSRGEWRELWRCCAHYHAMCAGPLHANKPCSFFLEGCCYRSDCKFSHDICTITCHFWEEGQCFKGDLCPFLHGYFRFAPWLYLLCRLQAHLEQFHFLLTTIIIFLLPNTLFFSPLFRSGKEGGGFSLLSFTCTQSSCTPFAISTDQLVVLQVLIWQITTSA